MAKRKPRKKNSKERPVSAGRKKFLPAFFVLAIVGFLIGVYQLTKPSEAPHPVAPATGELLETRPVLSPALFTGRVSRAYQAAREIPKVLDSLFCYCYCKKEKQHKNLLTCYTSRHGSKCDICLGEAIYAYDLYKQGRTLDEIISLVDRKFYRPYRGHTNL